MTGYCYSCNKRRGSCSYCCHCPARHQEFGTQVEMSTEVFSLSECLNSGELADVEIVVDCSHFPGTKATFKAHKMILAVQNEVFKVMFYGDFAKEDRVVITDLHPQGIRGLLRYFYTGRLEVANGHQAACTRTAAAKYLVPKLEEKCLSYVKGHMKLDDVCPILDYVLIMGEENLLDHASALISRDTLGVIGSSAFPHSTELTVKFVLRHAANAPEISVVKAVYTWACSTRTRGVPGLTTNDKELDIRPLMLPLFPELRFLALTSTEFVEGPLAWKIFTADEALAILSNIVKAGSMVMPKGFCQIRQARAPTPKTSMRTPVRGQVSGSRGASSLNVHHVPHEVHEVESLIRPARLYVLR
nr:BTB/POZ domain-containing protein 6-like [Rhipicephalus microplus]